MQDTKQHGAIDLDELVSTLLSEKAAKGKETSPRETVADEQPPEFVDEPVVDETVIEPSEIQVVNAEEAAAETATEAPMTAQPVEAVQEKPVVVTQDSAAGSEKPKKRRFGFRRRQPDDDRLMEEEWADWGLTPIGHYHTDEATGMPPMPEGAVLHTSSKKEPIIEPLDEAAYTAQEEAQEISSGREDTPQAAAQPEEEKSPVSDMEAATVIMPAVRPPMGDATRVVELPKPAEPIQQSIPVAEETEEEATQLPDQMSLEELVRVEDVEDALPQDDEDPAERLQRARQEKIKDFVLGGDEEEENEPEEEVVDAVEEPELEDFTGYETTDAVRLEMQYRRRASVIGMVLTGCLELLLALVTLFTVDTTGQSSITAVGFLTVNVFALILMAVLNYAALSRGLTGLFMLKANNDTAPAVTLAVAIGGLLVHFINVEMPLPMFAPLAGLLMLFNAVGQYVKIARIWDNFAFVSYPGEKYAAGLVEDEKAAVEIGRTVMTEGAPDVVYFRRAAFLSSYLTNAYEEDSGDRYAVFGAPMTMGVSLLLSLALLAGGLIDGFWTWLSTLAFMLCLSSFSLLLAMQLPMRRACRRMLSRGGFLVGWNAVDTFGAPDALVVDVADMYPDESMLLHGIKTFSGAHIDAAILDAASLSIRAGGPLSMIFRRIIENKENLLREVDSLAYEQGMGLSGWVDGRRVLVGNRRLLQNHDVDVPSLDYEARYAKDGRRLVYLSTSGVLSAMFVVSYLADEAIGDALHDLCRSRVGLLVRTNDSNITQEDLCRDFDLDAYYVDLLPAVAGRMYDRLVAEETAEIPALMASNGHILGSSMVLTACRSLRAKSRLLVVLQSLLALVGLGLCVPWALTSIGSYFLPAFGFVLGAGLLSWLLPLFKR